MARGRRGYTSYPKKPREKPLSKAMQQPATDAQKELVKDLAEQKGQMVENIGTLNKAAAGSEIARLKKLPNVRPAEVSPTSRLANPDQWSTADERATEKQLEYLARLDIECGGDGDAERLATTKGEASEAIEELKAISGRAPDSSPIKRQLEDSDEPPADRQLEFIEFLDRQCGRDGEIADSVKTMKDAAKLIEDLRKESGWTPLEQPVEVEGPTDKQLDFIITLAEERGYDADIANTVETKEEASALITKLKSERPKGGAGWPPSTPKRKSPAKSQASSSKKRRID